MVSSAASFHHLTRHDSGLEGTFSISLIPSRSLLDYDLATANIYMHISLFLLWGSCHPIRLPSASPHCHFSASVSWFLNHWRHWHLTQFLSVSLVKISPSSRLKTPSMWWLITLATQLLHHSGSWFWFPLGFNRLLLQSLFRPQCHPLLLCWRSRAILQSDLVFLSFRGLSEPLSSGHLAFSSPQLSGFSRLHFLPCSSWPHHPFIATLLKGSLTPWTDYSFAASAK